MGLSLTVYDGAGVIGGNKILLETDDTSLFLDFGTTFDTRGRYFEEYLSPRPSRGLLDLITLDLLPPLMGIYRQDMFIGDDSVQDRMSRKRTFRELRRIDGVLLSHAHVDHSGYIGFLREDIPVYSTAMTAVIAKAMQDSSIGGFEQEVCYQTPRGEKETGVIETIHYKKAPSRGRQFYALDGPVSRGTSEFWNSSCSSRGLDCQPLLSADKIGSLPLHSYPVDHSIFGAAAFALETELGWVVYTGDLRLHGKRSDDTRRFIAEAAALRPYLLICEGTHVGPEGATSEEEVHQNCLNAVRRAKGLVVADFGPRNIDRLIIFRDIALETGRKLAILGKDAYLLGAMRTADVGVPAVPSDNTICLYRDIKGSRGKWEKDLLEKYEGNVVDAAEVNRHQSDYILCLSFWDINELIDIDPTPGGVYVYSSSEAYSEEQQIDHDRMRNWLTAFDMDLVGLAKDREGTREKGYHASGHITGPDMLKLIETIDPQIVLPIHTQTPEFFVQHLASRHQVIVPERGQAISI